MSFIAIRCVQKLGSPKACTALRLRLSTNLLQKATITSAGGKPRARTYKAYDYRRKRFTHLQEPFDRANRRMDENSKVIIIDGPMAAGKTEFAKKLAHELDFKFVPQADIKKLYKVGTAGLTYQDLDELLPPEHRIYDVESFYKDKTPYLADGRCRAGELQLDFFKTRLYTYNDALLHLLSTGQGVVCVRSIWSDRVFAKALHDNGLLSREGFQYYTEEIANNHLIDYPRPHLVIYLDADVAETKENIKRRGNELEANSPILTDGYLQSIENEYKDNVLPYLERHTELLVYPSIPDITEHEISLMVEDIEALGPLEHSGLSDDYHLSDWSNMKNEELAFKRRDYQDFRLARKIDLHGRPWNAPEMLQDSYFQMARATLYHYEPGWRFDTDFDPELAPWWKIAMGIPLVPMGRDRRDFFVPA